MWHERHPGDCDADVRAWEGKIIRPPEITPEDLVEELAGWGYWDPEDLKDDSANWRRLIRIAAGRIQDKNN
jgi:hypothetical protein